MRIKVKRFELGLALGFLCFFVLWFFNIISLCGDGRCAFYECSNCVSDCIPEKCFNDMCDVEIGENCENSPDCLCKVDEICELSRADAHESGCYVIVCGDGYCDEISESESNCCEDCGCQTGYQCADNECEIIPPNLEVKYETCEIHPVISFNSKNYYLKPYFLDTNYPQSPLWISLNNTGLQPVFNVTIKAKISEYGTGWSVQIIENLSSGNKFTKYFYGFELSQNILSITEEIHLPLEIEISYLDKEGNLYKDNYYSTIRVNGRNDDTFYLGESDVLYITYESDNVKKFANAAVGNMKIESQEEIDAAVEKIYDILDAYGVRYVSGEGIYFPAETLKKKGGDCDNLAVLVSALLESIGIKTQLLKYQVSDDVSHMFLRYYNKKDWVPLGTIPYSIGEVTGFKYVFFKAEGEHTFELHRDELTVIDVEEVLSEYDFKPIEPSDIGDVFLPKILSSISSAMRSYDTNELGYRKYTCIFTIINTGDEIESICGEFRIVENIPEGIGILKDGREQACLSINPHSKVTKEITTDNYWPPSDYECMFQED